MRSNSDILGSIYERHKFRGHIVGAWSPYSTVNILICTSDCKLHVSTPPGVAEFETSLELSVYLRLKHDHLGLFVVIFETVKGVGAVYQNSE